MLILISTLCSVSVSILFDNMSDSLTTSPKCPGCDGLLGDEGETRPIACAKCVAFVSTIQVEESATSYQHCDVCGLYCSAAWLHRVSVPGYHFGVLNFLVCDRVCAADACIVGADPANRDIDVAIVAPLKARISQCVRWTKKDTRKIGPDARGRRTIGVKRDQEGYIHLLMTGGKPHYEEWYGIKIKTEVFWVGLVDIDGRTQRRFAKYIAQRDEGIKIAK